MLGIYFVADQLLVSQEEIGSMDLVSLSLFENKVLRNIRETK
jgi:hypothetical protein